MPRTPTTLVSFERLELDPRLLVQVRRAGLELPTDIQQRAVPVVLAGRDLMASAQTGTGKTLAFVLPALQRLIQHPSEKKGGPRVLILVPTRELAHQVVGVIRQFTQKLRARTVMLIGGASIERQREEMNRPFEIVVATPGRLLDLWRNKRIPLSRVEILILDEADRMLEMGFIDDVEQIAAACPKERQTLLFSATLEGEVEKIARTMLRDPAQIQVAGMSVPHANIEQRMFWADDGRHKRELLLRVLRDPEMKQALIFTNTRRLAAELAEQLSRWGVPCDSLHGELSLPQRRRAVDRLKKSQIQFLVATDVASRGLDLRGLTHVINFDLPRAAEDYIHRIGRTGRAEDRGIAVSLVLPRERATLAAIERAAGKAIERHTIPGLEPKATGDKEPSRGGHSSHSAPSKYQGKRPQPRFRPSGAAGRNVIPSEERKTPPSTPHASKSEATDTAPRPSHHGARPAHAAHPGQRPSRPGQPGFRYSKNKTKLKKVRYKATVKSKSPGGHFGGKKKRHPVRAS